MHENYYARVAFQEWIHAHEFDVFDHACGETDVLELLLKLYYYRRCWGLVDLLLDFARERGLSSPFIRRSRQLRHVPSWIFYLKDHFDKLLPWLRTRTRRRYPPAIN